MVDIAKQIKQFARETGKNTGSIEKTAGCPQCGAMHWIEVRAEAGCHELQCPKCFDAGYCVPLKVDGRLLFDEDSLPLPDEHFMAWFSERAAVRQYDGGLSRAEAERLALYDTGILTMEGSK